MKKLKICVYAICKNEEAFVERWMNSMSEADLIVVLDTGSTDSTVTKLREMGATVYEESFSPWRFDVARNRSLELVPDDVDVCVCTDLDEEFQDGWREKIEQTWESGTTNLKYTYNWSVKPDGTAGVQFTYFKIHDRKNYKWFYPIHEHVRYIGNGKETTVYNYDIVLNHFPDKSKSRSSYLSLLEMAVNEQPFDTRMRYYLGREYLYSRKWDDCISTLKNYLDLPLSNWKEERCAAMRWIAHSYQRLNKTEYAYSWYHRAISECPYMREPYIEFGKIAYESKDWETVWYTCVSALKIKNKSRVFVNTEYAWDHTPYDLLAISLYYLGNFSEALINAKKALEISPNIQRLKDNVEIIKAKVM